MDMTLIITTGVFIGILLAVAGVWLWSRYYEVRADTTYMTHNEHGFKRALKGKTILWDIEEQVVKGEHAPKIEFAAVDPATGGRRMLRLMDPRTGRISLRPVYCSPLPFEAVTSDNHKIVVDARVQFSLNPKLLKHVYEIHEFGLALDTRIQGAFRSEIGQRDDKELRSSQEDVVRAVVAHLRRAEEEGDEANEPGMALGVRFHTAAFSYTQRDAFELGGGHAFVAGATPGAAAGAAGAPGAPGFARAAGRPAPGALSFRPEQLDQFADVFGNFNKDREVREPASTAALLAMLEMQTRQNIAEALAASGQLIVVTPQEIGLSGHAVVQEALARQRGTAQQAGAPAHSGGPAAPNGGARPSA